MAYGTKHRTKKAQQLMWRWTETAEIRKAGVHIRGQLSSGKSIAGLSPFGMFEGYEDFRGYPIGVPMNEKYPVLGEPRIAPITGCRLWDRSKAVSAKLIHFDFSYANFAEFPFVGCRIEDCKLDSSVFNGTNLDGCTVLKNNFFNCDMRNVRIGTSGSFWEEEDSYIRECSFVDCTFADSFHRSSTFELCEFHNCTYTFTLWMATRFVNCKMSGNVTKCFFAGVVHDEQNSKLIRGDPGLTEQTIDFQDAQLNHVLLSGADVDYSKCLFPCDEDQFAMRNPVAVYEEVWENLGNRFKGNERQLEDLDWRMRNRLGKMDKDGKEVNNWYISPSNVAIVARKDNQTKKENEDIAEVRVAVYDLVRKIAERDGKIIR